MSSIVTTRPFPLSLLHRPLRLAGALLLRVTVVAVLVICWQQVTARSQDPFFPTPVAIAHEARQTWFSGGAEQLFTTTAFWTDVVPSFARMFGGWMLGSAVGAVLGIAAGESRTVRQLLDPPVQFLRALPTPAVLPIFLIIFGATNSMRVGIIAFGCTWPVLLNAMQATASIDPQAREVAMSFRLSAWRRVFQIDLPLSTPGIFAGMRIGLALALVLLVVSEWVVATSGLGFYLIDSQRHFEFTQMWAAMALLGVAGYVCNTAFIATEHRVLRWYRGSREQHPS